MAYRRSILAVVLTVILVASAVAGGVGAVADAPGADASQSTSSQSQSAELVTCQITNDCPTPESSADLNKSGAGVNVLIDGSHRGSTLTTFANALSERGFDVSTKQAGSGEGLSETDLSQYDVVVIPVPQRPYTDAELEKIHSYVRNGGAVFAVGQWTDPFRGKVADMNAITDPYGLHFNGETNSSSSTRSASTARTPSSTSPSLIRL